MRTGARLLISVAALLATGLLLAACGSEAEPATSPDSYTEEEQAADADAKSQARSAQTALETYAVDNDGRYDGADLAALQQIEPALERTEIDLASERDGYELTVSSSTGAQFSVTRDLSGATTYTCTPAGAAPGCPAGGDWS